MLSQKVIVLKLSGSLFFSEEFENVVNSIRRVFDKRDDIRLVVVTGGGQVAREYIAVAKSLGVDQASQDELGIKGSQINASVLIKALDGLASSLLPTSLTELVEVFEISSRKKKIVVCGGLQPGQSTNAVAALVSEKLSADVFINATDVDGVYTKDPRKFRNAKLLTTVTTERLASILESESMNAGAYDLMDPIALKLIKRSKIQTWITKCDGSTIWSILGNNKMSGTRIVF
ncbi:MAG: UMP kinase [Nitrososphaerota archaeon]|nr:UMP kinase [Nitrososphaerota archaeon]